ncbi:MAG: N-acetyl sugar amidotransferase [Candidatus Omnitrophica bacterium]|nr:N-acetyl sugar amidotransferase [Candidatus Omnitrophota bacterium]
MGYKICTKCIIDTTVPGAKFDESGVCSYCRLHDKLEKTYPINTKRFGSIVDHIKTKARGRKYGCVVGLSGGRDSTYTLYLTKKLGLRPLAVHFDDGFGNPVAGENMKKATKKLKVDLRTITSDQRESRDIRLAFLKASTPDLEEGADIGIATALYGVAAKENIKHILIGQSFRTEGVSPLEWNYLDGRYLRSVHKRFGTVELRKWTPENPGFNLELQHIFYYAIIRGIKTVPILYYVDYVRTEAQKILSKELGWVYPGAHYFDDLYQSLMTYVYRVKFNIDRRKFNYSALIRSGQMSRVDTLENIKEIYVIEDSEVIDLCIKRLGITREEFDKYLKEPIKTFRNYPTSYNFIKAMKIPIKLLSRLNLVPEVVYDKYFGCE